MAAPGDGPIKQLEAARNLALTDAAYYTQIVPGILPLIHGGAALDFRRWGSEFLAETFASPALANDDKTKLILQSSPPPNNDAAGSSQILGILRQFLERLDEDTAVVKSSIQAATSIYPLAFKHIIYNPKDQLIWQTISSIKSSILRRMDSSPLGVRTCCIKFVQRVAQTQTPGPIPDPRRPEKNEISLVMVPRDHPLLNSTTLEAEASGLLDRLLGILQETASEAILVTATLNSLGGIIATRPSVSNRVIVTVLAFNPFRLFDDAPLSSKGRVLTRSMERTTRSLLQNTLKRTPAHPLAPRIHAYLEKLSQARLDVYDNSSRKRPAPVDDGNDQAKRQRLGAGSGTQGPAPLPSGPVSFAQLFTLTHDAGSRTFDVQAIPEHLLVRVLVPLLASVHQGQLDFAILTVRSRYQELMQRAAQAALASQAAAAQNLDVDDDDDYEPDFEPAEDAEQLLNKIESAPRSPDDEHPLNMLAPLPIAPIGPFKLARPPPLTDKDAIEHGKWTIDRIFRHMIGLSDKGGLPDSKTAGQVQSFYRLAANTNNRDAWTTVLTRLATRSSSKLPDATVNGNGVSQAVVQRNTSSSSTPMSNAIREALLHYVAEDFRRRIGTAIAWLSEEWYSDRILAADSHDLDLGTPNFDYWTHRLFDTILPYLDAKDSKTLIVFLSEVPKLSREILERTKSLAQDPERVALCVKAFHYLIMFRPPMREQCLDVVEDLWRNYSDARNPTAKLLTKWRPEVLEQAIQKAEEVAAVADGYDPPEPVKQEDGANAAETALA